MTTGVGCHAPFQGIFPIQGSNPHLLHLLRWQACSLSLDHLGSPVVQHHAKTPSKGIPKPFLQLNEPPAIPPRVPSILHCYAFAQADSSTQLSFPISFSGNHLQDSLISSLSSIFSMTSSRQLVLQNHNANTIYCYITLFTLYVCVPTPL